MIGYTVGVEVLDCLAGIFPVKFLSLSATQNQFSFEKSQQTARGFAKRKGFINFFAKKPLPLVKHENGKTRLVMMMPSCAVEEVTLPKRANLKKRQVSHCCEKCQFRKKTFLFL